MTKVRDKSIEYLGLQGVNQNADGGFGLKHYGTFNAALLSNWIWKIMDKHDLPWVNILYFKYGDIKRNMLETSVPMSWHSSLWWRDIRDIVTATSSNSG